MVKNHDVRVQKFEENLEKHLEKKNKLIRDRMLNASEHKKHMDQLEEERELRRLYFQQEESNLMEEIMQKIEEKEAHFLQLL